MGHPLFQDVEEPRLADLRSQIRVSSVPKGTVLSSPSTPSRRLYLVLSGELRAYDVTADGRELLLEIIPSGGFDGLLSLTGRRGHFTDALSDSTVASLGMTTLERIIAAEPAVALNLIALVLDRLDRRERHLNSMALNDPDAQLARQLLALAETFGESAGDRVILHPGITHQMLADMLGLRRETVTLHLASLQRRGAVERRGRRLHIRLEALRRMLDPTARAGSRRAAG